MRFASRLKNYNDKNVGNCHVFAIDVTLSGLELHLHTLTLLRLKKTVNCQFLEFTGINLAFITWIEI